MNVILFCLPTVKATLKQGEFKNQHFLRLRKLYKFTKKNYNTSYPRLSSL